MFDPVLEKEYVQKGRRYIITISDKQMDYDYGLHGLFYYAAAEPFVVPSSRRRRRSSTSR